MQFQHHQFIHLSSAVCLRPWHLHDLTNQTHVQRTVARYFASLWQLRQICCVVLSTTLQMLMVALVHSNSQLDYGNSMLVSLLAYLIRQLQSVLNAAERLIYRLRTCDHITDCRSSKEYNTNLLFWRTKCRMARHHVTLGVLAPHNLGLVAWRGTASVLFLIPGMDCLTSPLLILCAFLWQ